MRPKLCGLGSARLGMFRNYLSMTVSIFKRLVLRTSKFKEATDSVQIFIKQICLPPPGPNIIPYSLAA